MASLKGKKAEKVDDGMSMEEFTAMIEAQEDIIKAQADEIEKLRLTASTGGRRPVAVLPDATFFVEGVEYRFKAPAVIIPDFGRVTAQEALDKPHLLEHLVSIGSGVIEKV